MKRTLLALAILLLAATAPAQTPPLISPEVHSDHRVTFRFRGPNVKEVLVSLDGTAKPLPMQKDDQGVWSATTDPLAPDYYNYSFSVDGVTSIDPSNFATVPNFLYRESSVHVPGPPTLSWETTDVPRGEVHHHFYKSGVVGDDRGFFVYTPPGYDPAASGRIRCSICCTASAMTRMPGRRWARQRDPGQSDRPGQAKPMLVVMPLGYGAPEVLLPNSGVFHDRALTERNFDQFRKALLKEVIPRVEGAYLVTKDRNARGIAGLSMGGSESLLTGLTR